MRISLCDLDGPAEGMVGYGPNHADTGAREQVPGDDPAAQAAAGRARNARQGEQAPSAPGRGRRKGGSPAAWSDWIPAWSPARPQGLRMAGARHASTLAWMTERTKCRPVPARRVITRLHLLGAISLSRRSYPSFRLAPQRLHASRAAVWGRDALRRSLWGGCRHDKPERADS